MNLSHPSTELLFVTVPIQMKAKGKIIGQGTGFILSIPLDNQNQIPLLITNYHIIQDVESIIIDFFRIDPTNTSPILNEKFKVEIDSAFFKTHVSKELDLIFIPMAPILENLLAKKVNLYFKSITPNLACSVEIESKLAAIEEVTFIGYPYGLQEGSKNLPIVRRGITATPIWANYKKDGLNETFLIDAGVFPGSSGSPVFIYNQGAYSDGLNVNIGTRLIFLGMIKASIQDNDNKQFIGLGEVIKSKIIFTFIREKLNLDNKLALNV